MVEHLKHLILYDGECGLCDYTVQMILKMDKDQIFMFAPLQGPTSNKILEQLPNLQKIDSAILIENFQTDHKKAYTESTTVFRIFWLLGGFWKLIGWMYYLPPVLFNWIYHYISRNRYKLVSPSCLVPPKDQKHRFLK